MDAGFPTRRHSPKPEVQPEPEDPEGRLWLGVAPPEAVARSKPFRRRSTGESPKGPDWGFAGAVRLDGVLGSSRTPTMRSASP